MTRQSPTWDDASEAKLATLWSHGISCSEIGRLMSRAKGSIVGKAHRMKLSARPSPIAVCGPDGPKRLRPHHKVDFVPVTTAMALVTSIPAPKPVFVAPVRVALPETVFLPRASRQCDFPMWKGSERPTHIYCESESATGRGYCPAHRALTHVKAISRAEAQGA